MSKTQEQPPPIEEQFAGVPYADMDPEAELPYCNCGDPESCDEPLENYRCRREFPNAPQETTDVTIDKPFEVPEKLQATGELFEPGNEPAAQPLATVAPNPLTMLSSALERGVDVEKLGQLMELSERFEANQARKAFALALSDFQGQVPDIVESKLATVTMTTGGSYTYSYADLDIIMKAIRPHLKRAGLSVRYDASVSDDGKRITSTCYVMHRDGHTESTTFTVPLDQAMKVNDSQKMGSANAYACRYNVVNALGLTTGEDDDAGALHGKQDEKRRSSASGAAPKAADIDEFFPIGKHKGERWDAVPLDYLEWAVANLTEKPDIVERARKQIEARLDSDDQGAQNAEAEAGELSLAECARGITNADTAERLATFWEIVPDKHRIGVEQFYNTRMRELKGKPRDDSAPF